MGAHARIGNGVISIDTAAWLDRRTTGPLDDLTGDLHRWAAARPRHSTDAPATTGPPRLSRDAWRQTVVDWCTARGHTSPDPTDPLAGPIVVAHEGTRLDRDLWLALSVTPDGCPIVVVQIEDDAPTVYVDATRELADWVDADTVQIVCPNGHGWWWRAGRALFTADGRPNTLTAVFGANLDAPFTRCAVCAAFDQGRRSIPCGCDGTPWIVCPLCGRRCDVDLPGTDPHAPLRHQEHRTPSDDARTSRPTIASAEVAPLPDDPDDVWQRAMRSLDDDRLAAARQANATRARSETGAEHRYYLARVAWLDQLIRHRTTT